MIQKSDSKNIIKEDSGKEELTRQMKEQLLKEVERMESQLEKKPAAKIANEGEIKVSDVKMGNIELLKRGIAADSRRIKSQADREAEAQRIKSEAQEEAEREMNSSQIGGIKGRVASKVISRRMSEAAYAIAVRLAEKANQGGHWAFFVFLTTFAMAVIIDFLDIAGELLVETIVGTIFIFLICTFLSLIIMIFWMLLTGGSHSKLFWKLFLRYVIFALLIESIPILELFPFTVFIVCWNWHDFNKEKREAKKALKAFSKDYAKTGRVKGQYLKYAEGV